VNSPLISLLGPGRELLVPPDYGFGVNVPLIGWAPGMEPPGLGEGWPAVPLISMLGPGGEALAPPDYGFGVNVPMGARPDGGGATWMPMPAPGLEEQTESDLRYIEGASMYWRLVGSGMDPEQAAAIGTDLPPFLGPSAMWESSRMGLTPFWYQLQC
jgi:hypothetical protein